MLTLLHSIELLEVEIAIAPTYISFKMGKQKLAQLLQLQNKKKMRTETHDCLQTIMLMMEKNDWYNILTFLMYNSQEVSIRPKNITRNTFTGIKMNYRTWRDCTRNWVVLEHNGPIHVWSPATTWFSEPNQEWSLYRSLDLGMAQKQTDLPSQKNKTKQTEAQMEFLCIVDYALDLQYS